MNIERQRIRETNAAGVLLRAGYVWQQRMLWLEAALVRVGATCGFAALFTSPVFLTWLSMKKPQMDLLTWLIIGTFIASVCILAAIFLMTFVFRISFAEHAGVFFTSADEVWVLRQRGTFQKFTTKNWLCLKYKASDITSVARTALYRYGGADGYLVSDVYLYFANGARYPVGAVLTEEEAYIVVTQLDLARHEIRWAVAA